MFTVEELEVPAHDPERFAIEPVQVAAAMWRLNDSPEALRTDVSKHRHGERVLDVREAAQAPIGGIAHERDGDPQQQPEQ